MRGAGGGAGAVGPGAGGKNFGNDGIPAERDGYPPVDGTIFYINTCASVFVYIE